MRVLSWNCRGLGNASMVHHDKKIAQDTKADFCFLLETHVKTGEGKKGLSKWGFDNCFEIPQVGLNGGLALGWNLPREVSIGHHNQNFIQTDIKDQFGNFCSITFIYGHLVLSQRKKIWEELESIANGIYSRWLCIGDFNQVMIDDDKFTFKPCHIPSKLDLLHTISKISLSFQLNPKD